MLSRFTLSKCIRTYNKHNPFTLNSRNSHKFLNGNNKTELNIILVPVRKFNTSVTEVSVIQEQLRQTSEKSETSISSDKTDDSFPTSIEHLSKYIKTDSIGNFNNALSLAIKRDDLEKGLKIWNVLNEQNITKNEDSYKLAIRLFVLLNITDKAESLKNEAILLNYRSSLLFSPLLEYYCVTKKIKDLTRLHKEIIQYDVEIDSYVVPHLIIGFARVNNYRLAIDTFYKFKEKNPPRIHYSVYNSIFPSLVQSKRYEEASELFKEMKREIPFYFIKYTDISSVAISGIVAFDGNFKGLLNFFEELKEHKIFVSEDHLLRALRGFYHKRSVVDFKEMLAYALNKSNQSRRRRYISIRQIFISLYKDFITKNEVEFSEYILDFVLENNLTFPEKFIAQQIRIYLRAGHDEKAYQMYIKYMNDRKIGEYIIEDIFYHYANTDNFKKAQIFLENLKSYDAAKGKFFIYCRTNKLKQAHALFEKEMTRRSEKDVLKCFNLLFESYIESGEYEEAQRFYMSARRLNLKPDSQTIYNIMKLTLKTKSLEECLNNFEKVKGSGNLTGKTRLLNCVIEAYIIHGHNSEAITFFVENFIYTGRIPNEHTLEIMKPILTKDIPDDVYGSIIDYFYVTGLNVE